jgi:hypothetical protein
MAKRYMFKRRKKTTAAFYLITSASLILGGIAMQRRRELKRLLNPFQSYISNNLFRKRNTI